MVRNQVWNASKQFWYLSLFFRHVFVYGIGKVSVNLGATISDGRWLKNQSSQVYNLDVSTVYSLVTSAGVWPLHGYDLGRPMRVIPMIWKITQKLMSSSLRLNLSVCQLSTSAYVRHLLLKTKKQLKEGRILALHRLGLPLPVYMTFRQCVLDWHSWKFWPKLHEVTM